MAAFVIIDLEVTVSFLSCGFTGNLGDGPKASILGLWQPIFAPRRKKIRHLYF